MSENLTNDTATEALNNAAETIAKEELRKQINEEFVDPDEGKHDEFETHTSEDYGANNIRVLEGLEAVRVRPVCTSVRLLKEVCITAFMKS